MRKGSTLLSLVKNGSLILVLLFFVSTLYARGEVAKEVMDAYGRREGNCLVIDQSEGLSLDLAKGSDLRIYLVSEDQEKVDAMRLKIEEAGKYGRITARVEKMDHILFPDFFLTWS